MVTGTGANVFDVMTSALTYPENMRYAVVQARHELRDDAPHRPELARVLTEMGAVCAEMVGAEPGRSFEPVRAERRNHSNWFGDVELVRRLSPPTPEWFAYVSGAGPVRAWTANRVGQLVGWTQLEVYPHSYAGIAMAVDPKQRGRGLGRGLLRASLEIVERLRPEMIVGLRRARELPSACGGRVGQFHLGRPNPR